MKKRTKIITIIGAISAGIIGMFGAYMVLIGNKYKAVAMYGVSMTEDEEIESFNYRFLVYQGRQKGSTIRSLIQIVRLNNDYNKRKIKVNGLEDDVDLSNMSAEVIASQDYEVELEYDEEGVICKVIIKDAN